MNHPDHELDIPQIPLERGHLLLVGTGALPVTALPVRAMTLRSWYQFDIRICMTPTAATFTTPTALSVATQNQTIGPNWDVVNGTTIFREAAEWADLVIVDPASTSFLGKLTHAITDSVATMLVMTTRAPVVLAPSMPDSVWNRPNTQRNIASLRSDGFHIVEPELSATASGREDGRYCDLANILTYAAIVVGAHTTH